MRIGEGDSNFSKDYIQVGDRKHRPGISYREKFGNFPSWGDDAM